MGRLFLGEPYRGLAGCPACLLGVLFGPYPRPRGLFSLLGVAVKGTVLWPQLPAQRTSENPRSRYYCQNEKRTRSEGQDGPAEPFQSLRDS